MTDQPSECLVHYTKETYGDSFSTDLLEQYKLYVQSAENVSARRVSSGRYLLTVNAALVALYGFQSTNPSQIYWLIPVSVVGIIVSILSFNIIKSHSDLNKVKFEVILKLEQHLPAALYDYEWQIVKEGRGNKYRPVSYIEMGIPLVFLALHFIVFLIVGILDCVK